MQWTALDKIKEDNEAWKEHDNTCRINGCDGDHAAQAYAYIDLLLTEIESLFNELNDW